MKKSLVIATLVLGSSVFAGINGQQEVANTLKADSEAIALIKAVENSRQLDCSAPTDQETTINRNMRSFSADYQCKRVDDRSSEVISTVTLSGYYTFRSDAKLIIRVNTLKIN